jgi:hypothetical protein
MEEKEERVELNSTTRERQFKHLKVMYREESWKEWKHYLFQ